MRTPSRISPPEHRPHCVAETWSKGKSFGRFTTFVRRELKLNTFDISKAELLNFYQYLDSDGDGLEVRESSLVRVYAYTNLYKNPKSFLECSSVSLRNPLFEQRCDFSSYGSLMPKELDKMDVRKGAFRGGRRDDLLRGRATAGSRCSATAGYDAALVRDDFSKCFVITSSCVFTFRCVEYFAAETFLFWRSRFLL